MDCCSSDDVVNLCTWSSSGTWGTHTTANKSRAADTSNLAGWQTTGASSTQVHAQLASLAAPPWYAGATAFSKTLAACAGSGRPRAASSASGISAGSTAQRTQGAVPSRLRPVTSYTSLVDLDAGGATPQPRSAVASSHGSRPPIPPLVSTTSHPPAPSLVRGISSTGSAALLEPSSVPTQPRGMPTQSQLTSAVAELRSQPGAETIAVAVWVYPDVGVGKQVLHLPGEATIQDLIAEGIRQARQQGAKLPGDSSCYELRMHDMDGEPDEDFPAMERRRPLKFFARRGRLAEFVLCAVPGATPAAENTLRVQLALRGVPAVEAVPVPVMPAATARDVIDELAKKWRLPTFRQEFQLELGAVDMARLGLSSKVLPPDANIAALGVEGLTLTERVYADAPPVSSAAATRLARAAQWAADGVGSATPTLPIPGHPSPRGLVGASPRHAGAGGEPGALNVLTAAELTEWEVIKVNARGRRQIRIMGIDLERITNRKQDKRRLLSDTPVVGVRYLRTVHSVSASTADLSFVIVYRVDGPGDDGHGLETRKYVVNTSAVWEAIVGKLEFVLRLSGSSAPMTRE